MNPIDFSKQFFCPPFVALQEAVAKKIMGNYTINGLEGDAPLIYWSKLINENDFPIGVIIGIDFEHSQYIFSVIQSFLPTRQVFLFPTSYHKKNFFKVHSQNHILRTECLLALETQKNIVIITYPDALAEMVLSTSQLLENSFVVEKGSKINLSNIYQLLNEWGFEKTDFVYEAGQYASRGGIIDVFSFGNELPYRIELDGNRVESIRIFNPETQLSEQRIEKFIISADSQKNLLTHTSISFFNYISSETVFFSTLSIEEQLNNLLQLKEQLKTIHIQDASIINLSDKEDNTQHSFHLLSPQEYKEGFLKFVSFCKHPTTNIFEFHIKPQNTFNREYKLLSEDLKKWQEKNFKLFISVTHHKQFERVKKIIHQYEPGLILEILEAFLKEGFIDLDSKIVCYTDHQIFQRYQKPKEKKIFSQEKILSLQSLYTLQPGDYITHIDYGVGRFSGMQKIMNNGVQQEAVRLIYKDNDILFVNINTLYKLSRYSSKDGAVPTIHKLGSDAWSKIKQKTKAKIKVLAFDLIQLYAKRKSLNGFAFSPDNYLQYELEACFPYEDTPDQQKVTIEVKKDMESSQPMDRLVCGDVGFGKTEIAVRAAFKACCDSKQVAILVPTTVLAFQHYKNFTSRLKDFPVTIDVINRFRTTKEKTDILEKLKDGKIDILIGTHALLNKKTKFKDLGLVIIDEEQKFGVNTKEALKSQFAHLDCLTLSATPIPRTLQFSLMGARDLSVIQTPPPNRQSVQTSIHSFHIDFIREAIYQEIERGGQVFFIHNRVQNILEIKALLQQACPELSIAYAHGQMEGEDLEQTLIDFIEKKYDVLLATNIIESGIDIANVNTIFINNAHEFGLSDLHQLRGRVGRGNEKAFCFLIASSLSLLSDESKKKLRIIEQFSDLGHGFQIAMKDLDRRGAGNILGAEQSGFINEIGLDAYQKILQEAVRELKQSDFKDIFKDKINSLSFVEDCVVETDLEIFIPDEYIQNTAERLSYYTKINQADETKFEEIQNQMQDRFGVLPLQVSQLFIIMKCRKMGIHLGFEKLILKNSELKCCFPTNVSSEYYSSKIFHSILNYIQVKTNKAQLKQSPKSIFLIYKNIHHIEEVFFELQQMNGIVIKEIAG